MDLRVTPQSTLANILAQLSQQTSALGKLQRQATTGKKIQTPSDDPVNLNDLLSGKSQSDRIDSFLATIQTSQGSLNSSVSALQNAGSLLTQAHTLAQEGAQATETAQTRNVLAQQVDEVLHRLIDIANTQYNGRYLFAGAASKTKPFVVTNRDSEGRVTSVAYEGAAPRDAMAIGPDETVATLYSGADIFQKHERGAATLTGTTGAAPGAGTDSATGESALLVKHASTTYASGAGIQAGLGSAAGDTILGPAGAHHLTIHDTSGTGASGTIALDGGPAVAFTSADSNLLVSGAHGEVVYVDASAITAGFNGNVDIIADGTLSVDGGATTVPIDFSANQAVTDSLTGEVTNINSTNIRMTGTDEIDHPGAYDAFQILVALRDDLLNKRGLPEADQIMSISARLGDLDRIHTDVLDTVGEQSSSLQNMDTLADHLRDVQLTTKQTISNLEDADMSQLVVQLQSQQNLLTLTLAVAARLQEQSFLDFMH